MRKESWKFPSLATQNRSCLSPRQTPLRQLVMLWATVLTPASTGSIQYDLINQNNQWWSSVSCCIQVYLLKSYTWRQRSVHSQQYCISVGAVEHRECCIIHIRYLKIRSQMPQTWCLKSVSTSDLTLCISFPRMWNRNSIYHASGKFWRYSKWYL